MSDSTEPATISRAARWGVRVDGGYDQGGYQGAVLTPTGLSADGTRLALPQPDRVVVVDDALLPTGALAPVDGGPFDLVLFGSESTDARMSVVPAMVAERLTSVPGSSDVFLGSVVAYANGVPFVAFRSLSDLAGGGAHANEMDAFMALAAVNSVKAVTAFLREMPNP